jgi:ABC-type multidrug transport system ATPase subunit
VLELIDLRKCYAGREVLAGASLTVAGGEALALVGANGSGKTTMLRCAVGWHHLDQGRALVDGLDVTLSPRLARSRMSYLPQRAEFPQTLTVREILTVAADVRDLPAAAVDRELALCGLEKLASRTVSKLSGGERQRLALAAVLLPNVNLYLIDEPTANLDEDGIDLFIDRVGALRDDGRAVLFTSHVGSDVERLATRVVLLRHGRIEAQGRSSEEDGHAMGGRRRAGLRARGGGAEWVRGAREWPRAVADRSR